MIPRTKSGGGTPHPRSIQRRQKIELSRPCEKRLRCRSTLLVGLSAFEPVQHLVAVVNARPCFMVADECDRIGQRADRAPVPHGKRRIDPEFYTLDHNGVLSIVPDLTNAARTGSAVAIRSNEFRAAEL